jgi:hypothetical protein
MHNSASPLFIAVIAVACPLLKSDGSIESARMAAVSPLADFSLDYQDLLLKPAPEKSRRGRQEIF